MGLLFNQSRQLGEVPPDQLAAQDAIILLSAQAPLAEEAYKDMTHDMATNSFNRIEAALLSNRSVLPT